MKEISIIGRGGQGGKTAAQILAELALEQGNEVQSFPEYGAERQGAPVYAYVRIDDKPIRVHSNVETPDVIVIIDPTLIIPHFYDNLKDGGILIVNTSHSPAELRKLLCLRADIKLYCVDATKIAMSTIGRNITNMPMLASLNKVLGTVEPKKLEEYMQKKLFKKVGEKIAQANLEAARKAAAEVVQG